MRRMFAAALSVVVILLLTACGSGEAAMEETMKAAREKFSTVQSMSYDLTVDLELTDSGEPHNTNAKVQANYFALPLLVSMDLTTTIDVGGQAAVKNKLYIQERDNGYTLYLGADTGAGGTAWMKRELTDMSTLRQYDARASMLLYLANADSFEAAGSDTVNGAAATRYDGVLAGEALEKVLSQSGLMTQFTGLGADGGRAYSVGAVKQSISIWLDDKDGLPVRCSMDLTDTMQALMDELARSGAAGTLTVESASIHMTLREFNRASPVVIPDEALRAS